MDFYKVAIPPAEALISLVDAKAWLRIDSDITADDTLVQALIDAAVDSCEKHTNRVFVARTIDGFFGGLSVSKYYEWPYLSIRRSPLGTISAVYNFVDGDYAVVDVGDYEIQESNAFTRVMFTEIPSVDTDVVYPFKVTFTAGYGTAADVPEDIVLAVKQMISFWYENRGDVAPDGKRGLPMETKAILAQYKIMDTF